jgi:hypothetical protein
MPRSKTEPVFPAHFSTSLSQWITLPLIAKPNNYDNSGDIKVENASNLFTVNDGKTVGFFIPIGQHGLENNGTFLDVHDMSSPYVMLLHHFLVMISWCPKVYEEDMKCRLIVCHTDAGESEDNPNTAMGVIILFNCAGKTFTVNRQDGEGTEEQVRSLSEQLQRNFHQCLNAATLCRDTQPSHQSKKRKANSTKIIDPTDYILPDELKSKFSLTSMDSPETFQQNAQLIFDDVLKNHAGGGISVAASIWSGDAAVKKAIAYFQDMGGCQAALVKLKKIVGSSSGGDTATPAVLPSELTSGSHNKCDIYNVPKNIRRFPSLFRFNIPRKWEPQISTDKLVKFYNYFAGINKKKKLQLTTDNDEQYIYNIAFPGAYWPLPTDHVELGHPSFNSESCFSLSLTYSNGNSVRFEEHYERQPHINMYSNKIAEVDLEMEIADIITHASGNPNIPEGIANYLENIHEQLQFTKKPKVKFIKDLYSGIFDTTRTYGDILQRIHDIIRMNTPASGYSADVSFFGYITCVTAYSKSKDGNKIKPHELFAGPPQSGKNVALDVIQRFMGPGLTVLGGTTAALSGTWSAHNAWQFWRNDEVSPALRTIGKNQYVKGDDEKTRDGILGILDNTTDGRQRYGKGDDGELIKDTNAGGGNPQTIFIAATNDGVNLDAAFKSRLNMRQFYRTGDEDALFEINFKDTNQKGADGGGGVKGLTFINMLARGIGLFEQTGHMLPVSSSMFSIHNMKTLFKLFRESGGVHGMKRADADARAWARFTTTTAYGHVSLDAMTIAIRELDVEKNITSMKWQHVIAWLLVRASKHRVVGLSHIVMAITTMPDFFLQKTLIAVLTPVKKMLYTNLQKIREGYYKNNDYRVSFESTDLSINDLENAKSQVNKASGRVYDRIQLDEFLNILKTEHREEKIPGGHRKLNGPFLQKPRNATQTHADIFILKKVFTPQDVVTMEHFVDNPLKTNLKTDTVSVNDTRHGVGLDLENIARVGITIIPPNITLSVKTICDIKKRIKNFLPDDIYVPIVINGKRKHELMEINNSLDILGESDDILLDKLYPLLVDPRLNDALKDLLNDQIVTIDYGDLVDVGFSKDIKTYKLKLEKYVHDGLVVFNDYNQYEIPPNTVIPSDLLGVIKASTFVYTGTDLVMRINEKLENSMQITNDTLYSILKIFKELNGVSGIAIQNGAVSGDKRKPGDVEVQSDEMEFTVSLKIETINEFKLLLEGPIGRTLANLRGATDKACLLQTGITMTNGSMRKIWYDPKVGKVNLQDGSGGLYSMKKETNRRGKQFN